MKQNETKIFTMFISRYTAGRNGKAVGWSLLTIVNLTRPKFPTMSRSLLVTHMDREVLRVAYWDQYRTQVWTP